MGLAVLPHGGSSQTRDGTCVSCVGRWILNHWAKEALNWNFLMYLYTDQTNHGTTESQLVSVWTPRRRQWHPTPVLLPGKSHGRRSLVGCSPWGHKESDWATSLSLFTFLHWRRKWQPTPVFLPGESQGRQSLVGCCLWGRTESDTTEVT